ncbi:hypothetical protein WIW50_20345 [Flavobacteriaceae bacterium 3-367]
MDSNKNLVINVLKYTFGLVPIVAGLDKFTNILTDWSQYAASGIAGALPFESGTLMGIVGVIEVVAGVLVLVKTKTGSVIVALWLVLIALVLITSGNYLDVAVRDIVMAIAAFSLFKLVSPEVVRANN